MEHSHVVNQKEQYPGTLTSWQLDDQRVLFHCDNQVILALEVLSDRIVRFRYATEGFFYPDFSYAIDPNFQIEPTKIRVIDREHSVSVKTAKLEIRLQKEGLLTTIRDRMGKLLLKDDKGFHWERNEDWGTDLVFMSKQAHQEESYFGLGDKSCQLNVRGERLENWVTDCFGYGSQTDPLYRAIPFYYGLREGRAYGIFFDNSFRTFFDFAKERSNASSFWAHGGEMNYYFIYGPELMDVAEQYTDLTGRPELPPQWAMGFHQCKWSYYPESRVREIASEFRERKIPCDAVYLDIDYMDGYRCFTWHPDRFPQPEKLIEDLKRDGFHTVVIIDPGIKIDHEYDIFQQGLEGSHY
ncbi:MAG: TIM-barrel domain-containing protein, partial [Bacteroidota bacterium]